MSSRLTPYGTADQIHNVAKVGKGKTPKSLAALMPSKAISAKVGVVKLTTPMSLAARMPTPEIAARVGGNGGNDILDAMPSHRLVRLKARG